MHCGLSFWARMALMVRVKAKRLFPMVAAGLFLSACVLGAEPAGRLLLEGTGQEPPWHRVESGEPGTLVMIVGGVHGNEPAGASAAAQISDLEKPP